MIRRLIILLLIVGCVFADTIVVKQEKKDKDGFTITYNSERTGKFEGILKTKVYLRDSKGKLNEYNCSDIIVIFDNERKPIEYDCSTNTFIPKALTEVDIKKIQKYPVVGGTWIAIGGGLLFSSIDKKCNDCETSEDLEDFIEGVNSTAKIGYGFIILGGILVAFGI